MEDTLSSPPESTAATTRRASARVRKQPQHFTSSPFSGAKRKRDEQDEENGDIDMLDEDESDEDEDPEDEPDEEEIREKAKKKAARKPKTATTAGKKPAQKKPKTQPNGISLPIRGATKKAPAKKRPPRKVKVADPADAEAAGGLYADLFARNKAADEVVANWLRAFDEHESLALADVINFVLKCVGTSNKVNEHEIEDPDGATARLSDLQDEYQATNPTDYPLIAKGKGATTFKHHITAFMDTFIKAIAASGLLTSNPTLLENVHVWLSTMSSATNRSFRHTATVLSLAVLTALCDVARSFVEKATTNQRQAQMERKKKTVNKERVKQFEQRAKEASANLEYTEALLKDWFDTIFIHRYRDVDPLIRRESIEALGDWIFAMPEHFFDGQHLRYLGWMLSDENASVRQEVVKQLQRLYRDNNKLGGLKTFTERFRPRMVEMGVSDADMSVRIASLELLGVLRTNDLLEPDDVDAIGKLIFHDEIKVRKAVSGFFAENVADLYNLKMDDLGGAESLAESLPDVSEDNHDAPQLAWLKLKALAEMFESYDQEDSGPSHFERSQTDGSLFINLAGTESRFTLAVGAIYDKFDELKGWEVLAGYLLFDHSRGRSNGVGDDPLSQLKNECTLTEEQELILLEILNASVKRSLGDLAEEHVAHKGKLTKRQKEDLQEDLDEAVRKLTELIPKLLKKFGDKPGTASAVLRLEGVFGLPSLQNLRQDPTVNNALLDDLRKQFMSHGTDEVLAPATAAILHAQSYGDLDDTALEKVQSLWDDVIGNLAELLNVTTVRLRGASAQDELVALSNNLLRIARLSAVSNPTAPLEDEGVKAVNESTGQEYKGAIDFIIALLERALHTSGVDLEPEEAALEDLVASRAAEAALFYFRWKFAVMMKAVQSGASSELEYEKLEALAERRDAYAENIVKVLDGRKATEQVCVSLTSCLLELYTTAAVMRTIEAKPGVSDDYTVLIMDLESEHETAVLKVFSALEKDYAKLSGKTLEDEVSDDADMDDVEADPIDDDPVSESDHDEEDPQTQASQQARYAKLARPLFAEQRLCVLTANIIKAVTAGVINDKATRKRLERNKTKLGPNFKEVLAYLDTASLEKKVKGRAKGRSKTPADPAKGRKGKTNFKSHAIVAEDEVDDEIEDDEERPEAEVEAGVEAGAEAEAEAEARAEQEEEHEIDDEARAEQEEEQEIDDEARLAEDEDTVNGDPAEGEDDESVLGD